MMSWSPYFSGTGGMSNTSVPYLSSVFNQTFLQTIIPSYVGLEEGVSGRKMWREFKSFAQYLYYTWGPPPLRLWRWSWGTASTTSAMHLRDFRAPHDQTSRSVAYSLIRCSLPASIHASYREGNAPENLRVSFIPLWHL